MVFQSYALFPHMTVLENVRYGLVVSGKAKPAGRRAGARRAGDRRPDRPRRAAAVRALRRPAAARRRRARAGARAVGAAVRRAAVEPRRAAAPADARGDPRAAAAARLTVVYVTHDQAEAMAVSDRIIVMDKAVIAQEGAPRELYEQPRDAFVAGFMGDANRVRGVARAPRCDAGRRHARPGDAVAAARRGARRRMRGRDPARGDRAARTTATRRSPPPCARPPISAS